MRFIWFRVIIGLGLDIAVVAHCGGLIPYFRWAPARVNCCVRAVQPEYSGKLGICAV